MVDIFGFPDDVFAEPFGGGAPGGLTYAQILAALAPEVWRRYNETSGTTGINYGSLGAAQNSTWTPGTGAVGQTGQLGANEAYSLDGADSKDQIPTGTYLNANKMFFGILCNPTNAGEGSNGTFFMVGSTNTRLLFNSSINAIVFRRRSGTDMQAATNAGLTAGVWQWLFAVYENDGDRKGYLYKGYQGVITALNKTTDTAATGTLVSETADLVIGNAQGQTTSFAGLIDEIFWKTGLTLAEALAQMTLLTTLSRV